VTSFSVVKLTFVDPPRGNADTELSQLPLANVCFVLYLMVILTAEMIFKTR
jgi:hypothetical protein